MPARPREVLRLPGGGVLAERVEAERAAGGEVVAPVDEVEERLGRCRAARDAHRREVEVDVGQHVAEPVGRHRAVADDEPQRGDAVLQVGGDRLLRDGDVGVRVPLADVPAAGHVAVRTAGGGDLRGRRSAGAREPRTKGGRPGHADRGRQVGGVLGGVERGDA